MVCEVKISSTLARFGLEILDFALGGASGALTEGRALLAGVMPAECVYSCRHIS